MLRVATFDDILERPAITTAGICAAAALAGMGSMGGIYFQAALGILAIALIAMAPKIAVAVAIPICMAPMVLEANGTDVRGYVLFAVEAGVLLRCMGRTRIAAPAAAAVAGLVAVTVISDMVNAPPVWRGIEYAHNSMIVMLIAFAFIPAVVLANPDPRKILKLLTICGASFALYCLIFGEWDGGRNHLDETMDPNATGHVAAVAVVGGILLKIITRRRLWLIPSTIALAGLLASQSRGGFLALGLGIGILWFAQANRRSRVAYALLAVGVIGALWGQFEAGAQLLFSIRDASYLETEYRKNAQILAFNLALQHPLVGIGYYRFFDYSDVGMGVNINTHNDYLRVAAESGVIALGFLMSIIFMAVRGLRTTRETQAARGMLATALGVFVVGNTMTDLRVSIAAWTLLGLALAKPETFSAGRDRPVVTEMPALRQPALRPFV